MLFEYILGGATAALLALRDPVGFAAYMTVHLAVRVRTSGTEWSRGR